MTDNSAKIIVGSVEWCSFPDLGVPAIKARVDSGAKTSSIHAFNVHKFKRKGENWVSFDVHPLKHNRRVVVSCESPVVDRRVVKSSSGAFETRYVISTRLQISNEAWEIELTLANRDTMGYRMLLGREAMQDRILVDPSLKLCQGEISKTEISDHYSKSEKRKSGLKIGLLASDQDLYSNQRLLEAGEDRGHEMRFLNIKHCYMKLDAVEPQAHYRGGKVIAPLDAVITRIRPNVTFYGCALTRQFESMGALALNSSSAIMQSRDKLYTLQRLLKSGIRIPTTAFANAPVDTNDLIDMVGGTPLIVKLLEKSQDRGMVLAETKKAAKSVINAFKAMSANLLIQEFVKGAEGKDIRCFVINGKVVASIQRESAVDDSGAYKRKHGSASVIKITAEEKSLAIKAARTLGLKIAGIDIIRSSKGSLLLGVTSSPELEAVEVATEKDIAGLVIKAIEKKLGWKKEQVNKKK